MPELDQEFILLPERGLRAQTAQARQILIPMGGARSTLRPLSISLPGTRGAPLDIIDSVHEDGPKLIRVDAASAKAIADSTGLRVLPVREYTIAVVPTFVVNPVPGAALTGGIAIDVASAKTGLPVAGVEVTAFTDFANKFGATAVTDAQGVASIQVGTSPVTLERLYIEAPRNGFWGSFASNVTLQGGDHFQLEDLDLTFVDSLRHFYPPPGLTEGSGVLVGVLDTGIDGSHADLQRNVGGVATSVVSGGRNTARGEQSQDHGDNGLGHGTHVAGILAAQGGPPNGVRGVAPGTTLRSYRVFGQGKKQTTNYEVVKAIIFAVEDGCDLLNLSLGGLNPDEVIRDAVDDAFDRGCIVVAAAGNDSRGAVTQPAAHPRAVAVSAMGRANTFPVRAFEESFVELPPSGTDPADFMASFTNKGREIFVTAPGVGILSTEPGGGYSPRNGTSMACPAATAMLARLIAANQVALPTGRDAFRSRAIQNLISRFARTLGFPFDFQGSGMLFP